MRTHRTRPPTRLLVALLTVALLTVPLAAVAAELPDAIGPGPEVESTQTQYTILEEIATYDVDLEQDGTDEVLTLSRDGIAQRYDPGEGPTWSVSYFEVAEAAGLVPLDGNSPFEGDLEGEFTCSNDDAVAYTDVDGDGVLDIVASLFLYYEADQGQELEQARSVVATLDGATGDVLAAHPVDGRVTALATAADTDGPVVFLGEEDGTIASNGIIEWGSGANTRISALALDTGTELWSYDTGEDWGKIRGLEIGPGPGGPTLAALVTGSFGERTCGVDGEDAPEERSLVLVDAEEGSLEASTQAPDNAAELATGDLTGDGSLDAILRTSEALHAYDGELSPLWTFAPDEARVLDVVSDEEGVLAAYTVPDATPLVEHEDEIRVADIDGATGEVTSDVLASGGDLAADSEHPRPPTLRLTRADLDGDGASETIVRSERDITAISQTGEVRWQVNGNLTEPHVLLSVDEGDEDTVYTKGVYESDGLANIATHYAGVGHLSWQGIYKLFPRDADTGERGEPIPLQSTIIGSARADVNDDGVVDRIAGGTSQALFATSGATGETLWVTHLDNFVLDVYLEDIDEDGQPEAIVESQLDVFALDTTTGEILWQTDLRGLDKHGSLRDFQLADVTGDGIRDVVAGTATGTDQAWSPHESARAFLLDGTDGEVVWSWRFSPEIKFVNGLDVGDLNDDGVPDVAVALDGPNLAKYFAAGVLDGRDGIPLWLNRSLVDSGDTAYDLHPIEIVDADGDGQDDLAIQIKGGTQTDHGLTTLDGRTGEAIWSTSTRSPDATAVSTALGLDALGDEDEDPLLVATAYDVFGDRGRGLVEVLTPEGETVARTYLPSLLSWEFDTGDVTGDGVADAVIPTTQGVFVLDGESVRSGAPQVAAQFTDLFPTKVELVDVDGDGILEIEHLRTAQGQPLHFGPWILVDFAGPAKAVGTLDVADA